MTDDDARRVLRSARRATLPQVADGHEIIRRDWAEWVPQEELDSWVQQHDGKIEGSRYIVPTTVLTG